MPISEHARRWLERVESVIAASAIAVAVVGIAVLPLTTPVFVGSLVDAVGSVDLTGLTAERTREVAEAVRVFVTQVDAPALPVEVDGRAGFDEAAASHLEDVRDVLVPARRMTLLLAFSIFGWALVRCRSRRGCVRVGFGVFGAGLILLAAAGVLVLSGIIDFDGLFAWFHSLFFAAGTWMFPADSLLIQVFPLPFWVVAGACWGGLVILSAVGLVWTGRRFMFTKGNDSV